MNEGRIVLSQLMDYMPKYEFDKCVKRYRGNRYVKSFSCYEQFLAMAFAQLAYRESLRDIETCLRSLKPKLYHAGLRGNVSRNTLAKANERRDWRIFADFANILIGKARVLYAEEKFGADLDDVAYALDSTMIDLCLSIFPWAKYQDRHGAIKLHTLLDLRGCIPSVVIVTTGKVPDVNILDRLTFETGAFYIMDRGYLDFARLYAIHMSSAFFVTRLKKKTQFRRQYSRKVDTSTGLLCDQTIVLTGVHSKDDYPQPLRRVGFYDVQTERRFDFLSNNHTEPALTVARLYKCRWQVELFFKWIKQHLRIKAFFGTSENAVKTQVWIAISVYVLVAIVKKRLKLDQSLYSILQILSVSLFEKTPISELFFAVLPNSNCADPQKQLCLWDF